VIWQARAGTPVKASAQLGSGAARGDRKAELFQARVENTSPRSGRSVTTSWSPLLGQVRASSRAGNPSGSKRVHRSVDRLSEVFFRNQWRLCLALCFGSKVLFSASNVKFHCEMVISLFQNNFVQKV